MEGLEYLSLQEYNILLKSGMLFVWYPHATGSVNEDLQAVCVADIDGRGSFYDIIDEDAEYVF